MHAQKNHHPRTTAQYRRSGHKPLNIGEAGFSPPVLQTKKERRATDLVTRLITPGNVLLSHGRLPQYPRRWGSSLPCSEWKRVLHPRYGHQAKSILFLKSLLALFLLKKHRAKSREFLSCFQIENMHGKPHGKLVRIC